MGTTESTLKVSVHTCDLCGTVSEEVLRWRNVDANNQPIPTRWARHRLGPLTKLCCATCISTIKQGSPYEV
jgi:hypothetical protein